MNYKGVCRTAPATPGLLNIYKKSPWKKIFKNTKIQSTEQLNYKLQEYKLQKDNYKKYRKTNYRNTEIQITGIPK